MSTQVRGGRRLNATRLSNAAVGGGSAMPSSAPEIPMRSPATLSGPAELQEATATAVPVDDQQAQPAAAPVSSAPRSPSRRRAPLARTELLPASVPESCEPDAPRPAEVDVEPPVLPPAGARSVRSLRGRGGRTRSEPQPRAASAEDVRAVVLPTPQTTPRGVSGGGAADEVPVSESFAPALADLVSQIREEHRHRQDFASAERRLRQQIGAIHRRFSRAASGEDGRPADGVVDDDDQQENAAPVSPEAQAATILFDQAREVLARQRRIHERRMAELARRLPVWSWVDGVRGIGPLGLAQLVGECGDIGSYASVSAVWKRMGVAVIESCSACGTALRGRHGGRCTSCGQTSIDRERQRRVTGERALIHGYNPSRRAVLYNLGESLVKQNREGAYRTIYLARKAFEATKPGCLQPLRTGATCVSKDGTTCRPAHLHARARRVMEKAFLRDLYREWRRTARAVKDRDDSQFVDGREG